MRNITVNITITPVSFADWLTANPGQTDEDTPCPTCQGTGKTTCKMLQPIAALPDVRRRKNRQQSA